jgi:hypothetical protein
MLNNQRVILMVHTNWLLLGGHACFKTEASTHDCSSKKVSYTLRRCLVRAFKRVKFPLQALLNRKTTKYGQEWRIWRKYEENMKKIWRKYEENMKNMKKIWRKYEENMKKIWRKYEENMQKYEEICIEINRKERFSKNVMMYNTSPKPQKSLYQSFQRPHKPSCLPRRQRSHTYHPSIPCCAMLCRTVPCLGHRLQEKLLVISHETFVAFLELGRGSHHALRPWSDTMVSCCLYPCGFY